MTPSRPGPARPASFAAAALAALALLGGCFGASSPLSGRGGGTELRYTPPPESAAFRALPLASMSTVAILKIEGDDVRLNAAQVSEVLLRKGYAVRDYTATLKFLRKERLLDRPPLDPEVLERVGKAFSERAAVAGALRLIRRQPLTMMVDLSWVDLRSGKVLWSVRGEHSEYILGFGGQDRDEVAIRKLVQRIFSVLPGAERP